jgi:hypothetical protein
MHYEVELRELTYADDGMSGLRGNYSTGGENSPAG